MSGLRDSRSRELAQLQAELVNVGRLLDDLERRSLYRRALAVSAGQLSTVVSEDPETRFAVCVASGMSKIQGSTIKALK